MPKFSLKLPLQILLAALFSISATLASAGVIKVASPYSVAQTLDRLTKVVTGAGATVFARVEHAKGAASIGEKLPPMALLIFGKPQVGTAAMQINPLAGLVLPARVLAYRDKGGKVWLAYQNPADMLAPFGIPTTAPVVAKLTKVLGVLTAKAVAK